MAFDVLYVSELLQKEKARTMRSNLNSGKNRRNSSYMKKVKWYQWGHKLRCQKTCVEKIHRYLMHLKLRANSV